MGVPATKKVLVGCRKQYTHYMKVDANVIIRFTELLISGFRFPFFPREKVGSVGLTDTHTGLRVAWGLRFYALGWENLTIQGIERV